MLESVSTIASRSRAQVELATIYEISKILSGSLDIEQTFREALNVLGSYLGFECGAVLLAQGDALVLCSVLGGSRHDEELWHNSELAAELSRVFRYGVPCAVPSMADERAFRTVVDPVRARGEVAGFVAVPIKSDRQALGVLAMERQMQAGASLQDDLRLLRMVANLMGQAAVLHRNISSEREEMHAASRRVAARPHGRYAVANVIGSSARMQQVFAEVHRAAPSRSTILLRGESGTGKEAIAHALHELSPRRKQPFIKVNCAALTESLLESELFGHERGAFTGAVSERKGRFEMANGGTLFLDEIGDISAAFQAKLLRVLQEREFERVGGSRSIKVDVRVICATNRSLEKMVAAGTFRADLYYRINVVSIFLPPLRERRTDIPDLVAHFVDRFNRENHRHTRVSSAALRVFCNCFWPGNVRELENCVERIATMTEGDLIEASNFPCTNDRCLTQMLHHLQKDDAVGPARAATATVNWPDAARSSPPVHASTPAAAVPFGDEKPEGDRDRLVWAMEKSGWVQAKAARLLNITPRQMGYALQKHHIEVRKF